MNVDMKSKTNLPHKNDFLDEIDIRYRLLKEVNFMTKFKVKQISLQLVCL